MLFKNKVVFRQNRLYLGINSIQIIKEQFINKDLKLKDLQNKIKQYEYDLN